MPDQARIDLGAGISVAWDDLAQTRASLASERPNGNWRLEGELGAGRSALRVLTGATQKGSLLLLAGARLADAGGHDSESPRAMIVTPTGETTMIEETLLSTQYSADGRVERVGLELYAVGEEYPVRGAGDAAPATGADEGHSSERAALDFRLDGEPGVAVLDILRA